MSSINKKADAVVWMQQIKYKRKSDSKSDPKKKAGTEDHFYAGKLVIGDRTYDVTFSGIIKPNDKGVNQFALEFNKFEYKEGTSTKNILP